jgi:GT2 family glycosyltransferase
VTYELGRKSSHVQIVILNWNGLKDTLQCLASIWGLSYENYAVTVVDNASDADNATTLDALGRASLHVLRSVRNLGVSGGYNLGIRHALEKGAEFILTLHNDTVVHPSLLHELVDATMKTERAGIVSPKIYFASDPERIWSVGWSRDLWTGLVKVRGDGQQDMGQFDQLTDVDCVSTCCMLIRRCVLEQIGLLDERFFVGFVEEDLCLRARTAGWRVLYVPSAKVWHAANASSRRGGYASPAVIEDAVRGYLLFMEKHGSKLQRFTSLQGFLLAGCVPPGCARRDMEGYSDDLRKGHRGLP